MAVNGYLKKPFTFLNHYQKDGTYKQKDNRHLNLKIMCFDFFDLKGRILVFSQLQSISAFVYTHFYCRSV